MAETKMVRVRTGETSYIEFNEADAVAWRAAGNTEYGAKPAKSAEPKAEPKPMVAPVSGTVVTAPKPAAKPKAGG